EQAPVLGVGLELRHHARESLILRVGGPSHFLKRLERFERLLFEALDAQVPEHRRSRRVVAARFIAAAESNVHNRRTIAFDDRNRTAGRLPPLAAQADGRHAERQVAVLRIAVLGMMARRAGYVLGSRQKRVPEQQPSQRNFCWGRRVVSRRLRSRRQRRSHTLSNGGNVHVKEYAGRRCSISHMNIHRRSLCAMASLAAAVCVPSALYAQRFQGEIQQMLARDKTNPPPQGGILFIGSSIFRFWTHLSEQMAPLPVFNHAFGGSVTQDILD